MKFSLVFLFSLLLGFCNSQTLGMREFEDYEKCYVGFVSFEGDTLFPPQFNSVRYIRNYWLDEDRTENIYWAVKLGEKTGLLSNTGEELIPMVYDYIKSIIDSVIEINIDGKKGIIDLARDLKVEPQYDEISLTAGNKFFLVTKDSKSGLLDLDYNLVVPLEYGRIFQNFNSLISKEFANERRLFFVSDSKNDKYGAVDVKNSTDIPAIYSVLRPEWIDWKCLTSPMYYSVRNGRKKW